MLNKLISEICTQFKEIKTEKFGFDFKSFENSNSKNKWKQLPQGNIAL